MTSADGTFELVDGRPTVRFERTLPAPPVRVWTALTDREDLEGWHPTPFTFEALVGGAVHFDEPEVADGELTHHVARTVIAHTWGDDHLRWELAPVEEASTRLVLVHTFEDRWKAARDAAGWHLCLDALTAWVVDDDGWEGPARGVTPEWSELNAAYLEKFGISPEQATPVPEWAASSGD